MLALLHTAPAHVETFERLSRELGNAIPIRHEVREGLLADALKAGRITDDVRSATIEAVQSLALGGAKVVVCTCSTIGSVAEAALVSDRVRVMRIDRPMAQQAVARGGRIAVYAALRSTFEPTVALLRQVASDAKRSIEVAETLCERAWPLFESGDLVGYVREIAATVEATARPTDVIVLAQASMAPAVQCLGHLAVPVLSSPKLGLEAAIALHRTINA
jgi:hypothetical protein